MACHNDDKDNNSDAVDRPKALPFVSTWEIYTLNGTYRGSQYYNLERVVLDHLTVWKCRSMIDIANALSPDLPIHTGFGTFNPGMAFFYFHAW
jgi:hypothetical protein